MPDKSWFSSCCFKKQDDLIWHKNAMIMWTQIKYLNFCSSTTKKMGCTGLPQTLHHTSKGLS